MTPTWADLLVDPERLRGLYSDLPARDPVTVRSLNLDRRGPTLILRLDLPAFPDHPLPEWAGAGYDRFQCQLRFLAVEDLRVRSWAAPVTGSLAVEPRPSRRVRVTLRGEGLDVAFTSADELKAGHLCAFRPSPSGSDEGPRHFVSPLDRRAYGSSLPDVCEKTFHARV